MGGVCLLFFSKQISCTELISDGNNNADLFGGEGIFNSAHLYDKSKICRRFGFPWVFRCMTVSMTIIELRHEKISF